MLHNISFQLIQICIEKQYFFNSDSFRYYCLKLKLVISLVLCTNLVTVTVHEQIFGGFKFKKQSMIFQVFYQCNKNILYYFKQEVQFSLRRKLRRIKKWVERISFFFFFQLLKIIFHNLPSSKLQICEGYISMDDFFGD